MKILYITPHLSTGGAPQYLLKKIEFLNNEHDIYVIEYNDYGAYRVQKNQIIDKKRIKKILNNIKKKSIKNNIDPRITNRIWKNMIWSYIDFERRNFKKK